MRRSTRTALGGAVFVGLLTRGALAQEAQAQAEQNRADVEEQFKADPHGYSAEAVGRRAADTSYQVKSNQQTLRGASARIDVAWWAYLPRISTVASYQRLSNLTPPSLGNIVISTAAPGPVTSAEVAAGAVQSVPFSFPIILDNWLLQFSLNVPLTDYFLRINQNYEATKQQREAARFDLAAARTKASSDGKLAFYNWMRAKGTLVVAKLALEDQHTHQTDTRNLYEVGRATQVDVLRGETAVSAAELTVVQAQNLLDLNEKQLRIALHIDDTEPLGSAETFDASPLPPVQGSLPALIAEGQAQRFEVRSLGANAEVQRRLAKFQRAGAYPSINAFGDLIIANPNQRIFPQTQEWFPTWDLGVRLTWSPNDIPSALGQAADAESRAASFEAQKLLLRDSIAVEVTQAFQAVQEADFSLGSTAKQLASAREAVRVARELFKAGHVNSTTLTDAETDLTRARLAVVNARIDARTARVRLEHAVGRDSAVANTGP
jgi:outer membrane protein TolC